MKWNNVYECTNYVKERNKKRKVKSKNEAYTLIVRRKNYKQVTTKVSLYAS